MSTKEVKQSNNGNRSTIKNDSTQSFESKFSEEPQNSLDSSESGQQYEIIEDTPFAAVKSEKGWKIVIGNQVATPKYFENLEEVKDYVNGEIPWPLIWTMTVWAGINRDKFIKNE